jgi:ATP-binding protein involved in chromosome partitioning
VVTEAAVLDALRSIQDPEQRQDIVSLGLVRDLQIQGTQVSLTLAFTNQKPATKVELHSAARKRLAALPGVTEVAVKMGAATPGAAHGRAHAAAPASGGDQFIPEVAHTIAVSSGKGGVGKSTVAVNLAVALRQRGATVGLVDADVYGPDVPLMLGTRGQPGMFENRIIPVEAHGVKMMSIGLLVPVDQPIVWRGPMLDSFIKQMLRDVNWGALDYLIFDMPPGTGDAQLSLSQVIPLTGALMVTTPQEVALLDVRKALAMFRKLNVPLLGIVENMSYFVCPHCHERTAIFGSTGGSRVASEFGVPLLAQLPLDPETRVGGDEGAPITVRRPDSPQAAAFRQLAEVVRERVSAVAPALPSIS